MPTQGLPGRGCNVSATSLPVSAFAPPRRRLGRVCSLMTVAQTSRYIPHVALILASGFARHNYLTADACCDRRRQLHLQRLPCGGHLAGSCSLLVLSSRQLGNATKPLRSLKNARRQASLVPDLATTEPDCSLSVAFTYRHLPVPFLRMSFCLTHSCEMILLFFLQLCFNMPEFTIFVCFAGTSRLEITLCC